MPCTILEDKVLVHFGFKSKVLPRPLADLSACVGFCTSSPQQGVKFQLRYRAVGLIDISCKTPNGKVLVHFKSKVLPGCLADSMLKVLH